VESQIEKLASSLKINIKINYCQVINGQNKQIFTSECFAAELETH
jgi:hypothetical protein